MARELLNRVECRPAASESHTFSLSAPPSPPWASVPPAAGALPASIRPAAALGLRVAEAPRVESSSGGSSSGSSSSGGGSSGGAADDGGVPASDDGGNPPGTSDGSAVGSGDGGAEQGGLDPGVAPGGNFDLSLWELQEPVGRAGAPTTILPAQLEGASGFHDTYFFTDPTDGSMSFWDPEDGVTTANSNYPRSELREMTSGAPRELGAHRHEHAERDARRRRRCPITSPSGRSTSVPGPRRQRSLSSSSSTSRPATSKSRSTDTRGRQRGQSRGGQRAARHQVDYVIGLTGNTISLHRRRSPQTFTMSSTFDQEGCTSKRATMISRLEAPRPSARRCSLRAEYHSLRASVCVPLVARRRLSWSRDCVRCGCRSREKFHAKDSMRSIR